MRVSRDLGLLGALVAVLVIGLLVIVSRDRPIGPPYRLDGHGPWGLSGLGAGLRASGSDVHSRRRPTMAGSGLTVSVQPAGFTIDEADRWVESVRGGATLLLATTRESALTEALGLSIGFGGVPTARTAAGSRAFPAATAPRLTSGFVFTSVPGTAESLWAGGDGDVMVVFPLGRGSVWAISDPRWLTNGGVEAAGLPVALPLARMAGGEVWVDEYHHGVGEGGGTFGYLPGWSQLVVIQLAVVLLAAAATAARRLGPVRPVREPATRSTAELAGSLARMHRKAHRLPSATAPLAAAARRRFGEADPDLMAAVTRLEHARGEREAVEACAQIEQATRRLTGANR